MKKGGRNKRAAFISVAVLSMMLGLTYAAVPFYRMFCSATGFAGALRTATSGKLHKGHRVIQVRFDANVSPGLDWSFAPETNFMDVPTGQVETVYYKATNNSDHVIRAHAQDNVIPGQAGAFFEKIKCFCDSEETLAPGETKELPVVFFLDPKLEKDETMAHIESLTLSYTYFAAKDAAVAVAVGAAAKSKDKL